MVYFDNAATTYPKPEEVYSYMNKFYRESGVNVGRGQYKMASYASNVLEETKSLLKELLVCHNKEIVFTSSATEALNIVLRGLEWINGANVYITPFEHNSVLRVLYYLESIYDLNIKELSVNKITLEYEMEKIRYDFQENKPNVVIVSHASNMCGLIAPIKEICDLAKIYDSTTIIDMSQTAGLIPTDLSKIKTDYTIFAAHKTLYGSFGLGGIILNRNAKLKPFLYGGAGIDSASKDVPETIPEKFEIGSQNIQAIAALNASLKWINKIGIGNIYIKEITNTQKLVELLCRYENTKIIGYKDKNHNIGVISCIFEGYSSDNIGQVLNECDIAVRTGLHCAPLAHKFFGTFPGGTVRFSLGYFNDDEDVNKLKEALDYIELYG